MGALTVDLTRTARLIMQIFRRSFPVINPYRLYESMQKYDGWHFSKTCPVVAHKVQTVTLGFVQACQGAEGAQVRGKPTI